MGTLSIYVASQKDGPECSLEDDLAFALRKGYFPIGKAATQEFDRGKYRSFRYCGAVTDFVVTGLPTPKDSLEITLQYHGAVPGAMREIFALHGEATPYLKAWRIRQALPERAGMSLREKWVLSVCDWVQLLREDGPCEDHRRRELEAAERADLV